MEYSVGEIVETRKQHPGGSKLWKIKRVGVDFKLECNGCGHEIMIERQKALKMVLQEINFRKIYIIKKLAGSTF